MSRARPLTQPYLSVSGAPAATGPWAKSPVSHHGPPREGGSPAVQTPLWPTGVSSLGGGCGTEAKSACQTLRPGCGCSLQEGSLQVLAGEGMMRCGREEAAPVSAAPGPLWTPWRPSTGEAVSCCAIKPAPCLERRLGPGSTCTTGPGKLQGGDADATRGIWAASCGPALRSRRRFPARGPDNG